MSSIALYPLLLCIVAGSLTVRSVSAAVVGHNDDYVAAVVEYPFQSIPSDSSQAEAAVRLTRRIDDYVALIGQAAAAEADIIVFPEATLTQPDQSQLVPQPEDRIAPYLSQDYPSDGLMSRISEAALRNRIYVVINLTMRRPCESVATVRVCEPHETTVRFNTNVVFDRSGTVISM